MTWHHFLTTFAGAAALPAILVIGFPRLVKRFGLVAGFLFSGFIVGSVWLANHGAGLFYENVAFWPELKGPWFDMAWAGGIGLYAASVFQGKSIVKGLPALAAGIASGLLGGLFLYAFIQ